LKLECTGCPALSKALLRRATDGQSPCSVCIFRRARACTNQVLFPEASSAEHLYALRSGMVKVVKSLENGKVRILRVVYPGTLLGLEALSAATYSGSAVALQDSEICAVSRDDFLAFLRADPEAALDMIGYLAGEMAQLNSEMGNMSFKDARAKVATLLRSLFSHGEINSQGVLTLPFTSQEIGEILELTPETVSRTWTALCQEGVIEKRGRKVIVRNPADLEKAAQR
jgi:CRP-like cAMP-binding protein